MDASQNRVNVRNFNHIYSYVRIKPAIGNKYEEGLKSVDPEFTIVNFFPLCSGCLCGITTPAWRELEEPPLSLQRNGSIEP